MTAETSSRRLRRTRRSSRSRRHERGEVPAIPRSLRVSPQFWFLTAFLVLVFLIGGGSRGDIASLMVLRPVSILVASVGAMSLTRQHMRAYRWLFVIALACLGLAVIQLVPLPPRLFYALPGRGIVGQVDTLAGLGGVWHPMSLTPAATWNALWAMVVPLAVLLLAVQLDEEERRRLVSVLLLLGFVSGLLSLLQISGDPQGPLYPYDKTNNGMAVGLFANRNHQGVFLATLIPMLVAWAVEGRGASWLLRRLGLTNRAIPAILVGFCLIPLILITGSRAGLITGLIAGCSIPLLLQGRAVRRPNVLLRWAEWGGTKTRATLLFVVILGLITLTIWVGRALAWDRLIGSDPVDDLRFQVLPSVLHMIRDFAPWGSGLGSFEPAYWLYEPDHLLMPAYMNHAHDDWLEIVMTGGVPAALVALLAVVAWGGRTFALMRNRSQAGTHVVSRLGLVIILMLAVASLSDYPVRVPSLACLLVCAAVWASGGDRPRNNDVSRLSREL